jgi:transcriptional regulator with PAS, ATPase and Fis domain
MKTSFLETMLNCIDSHYAILNKELVITEHSQNFGKVVGKTGSVQGKYITDVIYEAVGLEAVLADLHNQSTPVFGLQNINRELPMQPLKYFDIFFIGEKNSPDKIFCLVHEVTEKAELIQNIRQKDYRLLLLESMIAAKADDLSTAFLGVSSAVQHIRKMIEKISKIPNTSVLLLGESGTGKSMVAKVIHIASLGKDRPFVEINCAAIPENLLESELFGYEKGAFTNASSAKPGLIEAADGGTLFLDEISEMSPKLQAKLLSFLETRTFRRLGSNQPIEVQTRIIAATNREPQKLIREKKFREDLYYRLSVVTIKLPTLKQMEDDVVLLAQHFVQIFNHSFNKKVTGFTPEAENLIRTYDWPGNVRELRNVVERAMIFAEGTYIAAEDLQIEHTSAIDNADHALSAFKLPRGGIAFEALERKILLDALKMANGNQSKAARLLQLTRDAFRYRLEKYKLI